MREVDSAWRHPKPLHLHDHVDCVSVCCVQAHIGSTLYCPACADRLLPQPANPLWVTMVDSTVYAYVAKLVEYHHQRVGEFMELSLYPTLGQVRLEQ